jgi:hypothetical protein
VARFFRLGPDHVRRDGRAIQFGRQRAREILDALRGLTTKTLTEKNPNVPTVDALNHWEELRQLIIQVAALYSTPET